MTTSTPNDVLVLHAVRTLGYADTARIAERLDLQQEEVGEYLLDAQAHGWTTYTSYAGDGGWSLTEAGKTHGELQLAAELDATSARGEVEAVYEEFLPANDVVAAACGAWQLAEMGIGDKSVTLASTIAALQEPARVLVGIEARLTMHFSRFAGYHHRFTAALAKAATEAAWITGTERDSCHRVWFELHEDLIATLRLTRCETLGHGD